MLFHDSFRLAIGHILASGSWDKTVKFWLTEKVLEKSFIPNQDSNLFTIKSCQPIASHTNFSSQEISKNLETTFSDRSTRQVQKEQKQTFSLSENWLTALLKVFQENQKEARLRRKEKRLRREQKLKERRLQQQKQKEERLKQEQQLKKERLRKKEQDEYLRKQRQKEELAKLKLLQEQHQKEAQKQIKWDFGSSQSWGSANDKINVRGYKRQDGTYVRGYQRRKSK